MAVTRSPGYPSISLAEAIELTSKLYEANRTNPADREAAAKDIGYSGMSGTSAKALADLAHYGLIEKAGKGGVRVSQRGVDILYPENAASKNRALHEAAARPQLFAEMQEHFSDGRPSENSIKVYLMRRGFASVAIPYVLRSYTGTLDLLQQAPASESHGDTEREGPKSAQDQRESTGPAVAEAESRRPVAPQHKGRELPLMEGERIIFMDEVGPGQYLKVVASGDLDASLLEAMEDFTKRRRKRLGPSQTGGHGEERKPN